jgi:hypothetical protein
MKAKNPFEYGSGLRAETLVDREKEVAEVINTITEGGKLFLMGPRRYGKTSILKAAQAKATEQKAIVLRFNAEAYATLEELIAAVLAEATNKLSTNLNKASEKVKGFFGSLKPELTFDLNSQTVSAKIGAETDPGDESKQIPLLVEAFNGLENMAAKSRQAVGLMIDEFQKVIELGGDTAEAQLRAAIQEHQAVGYVFAGSKTRMMAEMTSHPSRPFYHLGERLYLKEVPRADFKTFLTESFKKSGFKTEDEAIELILDWAEEVPYNVQQLAHYCWDTLVETGKKMLTSEVVGASLEELLTREDALYTMIWNQLTSVQQRVLIAVLKEKGVELHSARVTRKHGLSPGSVTRALQALQEREILRTEESRGQIRLRLLNPFFGSWLETVSRF